MMTYLAQRQELCEYGHKLWSRGWVAANDGNLSMRLPDGNILVTPTGVSKGDLTPEMLLVCDLEGRLLEENSNYRPSSETKMHLCIYKARPDVGGVCHSHSPAATAFACARKPIDDPILGESIMQMGRCVPVSEYARTGTAALPAAIEPLVKEGHSAILLANHGAVTLEKDLKAAYWRMETLELTAQIHLNARILGGGVPLTEEQVKELL
ncbi:MAG: class II aldolase/adducin family protein [Oscillospiraceae bacterium]|nr:class II aldolase/adducin family protein [Oscillospiraceae bacterium]